MRLLPRWGHSVLSPPLDPWDRWDLYHLWVHSDRSHLEVHLDPWLPRLLPVQRDPTDQPALTDLLRLWILPDHWDPQDP